MFVTDKVKALPPDQKFVSFEFFPPKTDGGFRNLLARLSRMKALNPLFITITWGAGGSTNEKSIELAGICQKQLGITTVLHLTCTNTNREIIDNALEQAKLNGITNILALRGDPPRNEEYWTPNCDFNGAVDLVKYIRSQYDDYFCIGVAGYAEGHVDGADSSNQNPVKDMPYLIEKIKAGADYIVSQLFYDVDKFLAYDKLLKSYDELKDIILIPGLMPITTFNIFNKASKLSHASIPRPILDKLVASKNNDDEVKSLGLKILCDIIETITVNTNIKGFHFYTLNLERAVASILETSDVFSQQAVAIDDDQGDFKEDKAKNDNDTDVQGTIVNGGNNTNGEIKSSFQKRRRSSVANEVDPKSHIKSIIDISKGKGQLGKDANWDDFPNGRFGDSSSPAYGEIDGYGPTLKVSSPEKAIDIWGSPESTLDLSKVFINYLSNVIPQLPWTDLPLQVETTLLQEQLFELNLKGWFSTSSQPAINGCLSNDKMFGWGPPNGIVYQKSFVELFIPKHDWHDRILPQLQQSFDERTITYYIGDKDGNIESNLPRDHNKSAITWGVFPLKEVLQPTVIDLESFKAWNEEAFLLWLEWARCYKKTTNSYQFLNFVYENYYLISLVHHDFINENGLWDTLLSI